MEKILVHTLEITKPQQKLQFEILFPENTTLLTGIEVTTNRHVVAIHGDKLPHYGVGIIRLFVADDGDCLFSQMLHADHSIPKWEALGEVLRPELWNQVETAPPFLTKQFTKATVINGFYEDLVGALIIAPPNYKVSITLYYEI